MLNKILVTAVLLAMGSIAFANTQQNFEQVLGRKLTKSEVQQMKQIFTKIAQSEEKQNSNIILAASNERNGMAIQNERTLTPFVDNRTVPYNMACVSGKYSYVASSTQQLVCANIYGEVFTISKSTPTRDTTLMLSLGGTVGVLYARMFLNEDSYNRIQGFAMLQEPIDAIGFDFGKGWIGAQFLAISSPNLSLKLVGWTPGWSAGTVFEQNGDVKREAYEGSVLTVKKFHF